LFSAAGAAAHGAGTRDLDRLGGLAHRMPKTAALFLIGAAAASALPGFAGFVSEWFTMRALFAGLQHLRPAGQTAAAAGVAALALTGALAAAGYARSWGAAFAGFPRSEGAAHAREAAPSMLAPMAALAGLCVLFGIFPSLQLALVLPAVAQLSGSTDALVAPLRESAWVGRMGAAFFGVAFALALLRRALLGAREVRAARTWACGYPQPTPRMQYTATGFAQPLTQVFHGALAIRETGIPAAGYFPAAVERNAEADDPVERALYRPLLSFASDRLLALRRLHGARVQQYLLYIFFAVIALLIYASRALRS
jgi:NADH:ubiquinone oxidoreductase subunit 5 (subunit L)/multisubunit Na+/H+ antiporter MnhA subunit